MPVTAIAEMAMVAAIVPFLALLAGSPTQSSWSIPFPLLKAMEGVAPGNMLIAAATLFALAALATGLLRLALTRMSQAFALGMGHDLAVEIQRRLLHQPYQFHLSQHSSELLSSLDKVDHLIFNLVPQSIQAMSAMLITLLIVIVLVSLDPMTAALAVLLVGGLYGLVLVAARRRLSVRAKIVGSAYQQRLKALQESLGGIRDVILDQSQDVQLERFREIDERFMRARAETAFLVSAPRFMVEALGLMLIALLAVIISGRPGGFLAALPVIGAMALGAQRLLPLINQLYSGWANLTASRPIIAEVAALAGLPIQESHEQQSAPMALINSIKFDDVSFQYADRSLPALHNLRLTIPKGARVAIVGPTGSGKSTFADLLMGLIEPNTGWVRIDGVALTDESLGAWRQSIAHVPQAIFLEDASIAENIARGSPGVEKDMMKVRRSAETAQLADFIESLPDGYETQVGERGVRLSGGQRQRLGLARAIYKNAPVLVLDEATNALDEATEASFFRALDQLGAQGRTIIIVAHRRSTIDGCDLILRLDQGRLIFTGSREPLFGEQASAGSC